jgi:hypothetical protein
MAMEGKTNRTKRPEKWYVRDKEARIKNETRGGRET